jgi:hypothetical protein
MNREVGELIESLCEILMAHLRLFRRIEWAGPDTTCPDCHGSHGDGHRAECLLHIGLALEARVAEARQKLGRALESDDDER